MKSAINHQTLLIVMSMSCLFLLSCQAYGQHKETVNGIYVLNPRDTPISDRLLEVSNVTGISLRVSWKTIEPEDGKFDWSYLDKEIDKAERAGKAVTLRIMAGIHAPDWVYAQGVKSFEFIDKNPHHGEERRGTRATFGKKLRIPIPWDETFLKQWMDLIAVAGERYAKRSHVVILHVTGPNRHSAEMHLPKEPEDRKHWREIGYTPQNLIEAWHRCIDAWAQAFPLSYLSLNLSPVIFDDGVMEAVARYGHEKHGKRLLLQNNALSSNVNQRRKDFQLIRDYAPKTTVGFQMLAMATAKSDRRQGDLKESIDHGLSIGASYFEIYPLDILRLSEVIKDTSQKLHKQ